MKRGVILIVGVVFLVVIGVIAILAARSGSNKAPTITTLKVWSPFEEDKAYLAMSQSFLAANPNVQLEFKYIDAANAKEYEAKVVDAIASGTGPDVWLIRTDWLPKHEPKLVPSTAYVKWSTNKKVSEKDALAGIFTEPVRLQNSRDDQLYGVPLAIDSLALYVNKTVLSQARREFQDPQSSQSKILSQYPTTWGELEQWSRLLTKTEKGAIVRSGLALGTPNNTYASTDVFTAMLLQRSGSLFTNNEDQVALHLARTHQGQTTFPGQEALAFYSSFATPGNPNYSWNASLGDPVQAFAKGKAGMLLAYSTIERQLLEIDKNIGDSISIRPLPQINPLDVKTKRIDFAAYWTHVVSKNSTNPTVAWQFIKELASQRSLRAYEKATGKVVLPDPQKISVDRLSTNSSDLSSPDIFASQLVFSQGVYKPEWQAVDEILQDMLIQTIDIRQSPQVAIDSAAERLKKLINQ